MSVNSLLSRMRYIDLFVSFCVMFFALIGAIGQIVSLRLPSFLLCFYCLIFGTIQFLQEINFKFIRRRLIK